MEQSNLLKRYAFRRMANLNQSRQMAQLNKLKSLQKQLKFWEQRDDKYKRTVELFKEYINTLREFNHPRELINSYIRMAQYCERQGDRLLAQDTYRMALEVEEHLNIDPKHMQNLRTKISSLSWF